MADIAVEIANLQDSGCRATALALAVESLALLFDAEASRLRRKEEVARLEALRSAILQGLERARMDELSAESRHSQDSAVGSLFRLGTGLFTMTSENKTLQAISHRFAGPGNNKKPPYGEVLVCIGPQGVPCNVEVVSISSLARESKRDESEIKKRLRADGSFLLGEEAFSRLIDRLIDDILEGSLVLPLSGRTLSQLQGWSPLRLVPKNEY